jgi:hypothetical protein
VTYLAISIVIVAAIFLLGTWDIWVDMMKMGRIQKDIVAWLTRVGEPVALKLYRPPEELMGYYSEAEVKRALVALIARGIVVEVGSIPSYRLAAPTPGAASSGGEAK